MERSIPKRGEKRKAFDEALRAGLEQIDWYCKHHEWTIFLVAGGRGVCKVCNDVRNEITNARTTQRYHNDPEYYEFRRKQISDALAARLSIPGQREEINAYFRKLHSKKSQIDPQYVGQKREYGAAVTWRTKGRNLAEGYSERTLPAWYSREKEALQKLYEPRAYDDLYERDHLIARNHKKVTGLHCWANVVVVFKKWNRWKGSKFDVTNDNNRWHRPANRHSGGAFDPNPTLDEQKLIRKLWTEEGIAIEDSLRILRDSLDQLARTYEEHVSKIFGMKLPVDPAWYERCNRPEGIPLEAFKGFDEEPAEKAMHAFLRILN
ncbi:hypothetical protein AWB75_00158 [Caballeronia catudaia]|uniref:Uncharacterized protein n=1 Tax=Caballeronia catudaia TaxID=1777136 RepID=A0A157Z3J5_9BURK|nr:hypothetical protein [Caballeronia catudaia]SAK40110.1 hypothetical protein AWB75_00158 [Caballeronia catudaia]